MPVMQDGGAFKDHFSAQAGAYERCRPDYPPALFEWLATVAPGRGHALDVGAGNGQAALGLAQHFERVRASEPSEAQLARARPHRRVEYAREPAERIGVPDASADLVTAAQAAHWFDWARFCPEVRRVLRPGGVVAVWTYGLFAAGPDVDRIVEDFYRNVVGPYWPRERRHVEEGYRDLPFPFDELMAPRFSLETRWTAGQALGYLGTWSAVQRYRAARGRNPLELVAPGLCEAWRTDGLLLTWPLHLRVGRC